MMQKIRILDHDHAVACVAWLEQHVGPRQKTSGSSIVGTGWRLWVYQETVPPTKPVVWIEVNDHVDDDTQLWFSLKWSQ